MANRPERLYKIERLVRARPGVTFAALMDELEVSRATLKRDLEYLRSRLGAPIEYDRDANGYRLVEDRRGGRHELPGLWFDERELYALLAAHQLLSELDEQGTLARHLQPLLSRIHELLAGGDAEASLVGRVRIVSAARRPAGRWFDLAAEALATRRRLRIVYLTRSRGERGAREVSPQRLVHYRGTWYLDAWCHRVEALRRFAVDAIEDAAALDAKARAVPERQLEAAMDAGYGIYAGASPRWATLAFSADAARWVEHERWHPQQQGRRLADGRWELRLPYADDTELVMDLLRHGEQVEVLEPADLRQKVALRLAAAAARYRKTSS